MGPAAPRAERRPAAGRGGNTRPRAQAPAAGERGAAPGASIRKKSGGVLREGVAVRYACIARHRGEYPVRLMCGVLEVGTAGFYAWSKRSPCERAIADERLMLNVRISHSRSKGTYG